MRLRAPLTTHVSRLSIAIMNAETPVQSVETKFSCRYCKSEIDESASKCPRCRSFLGRFGWVKNATTELSVLSIVVSIFALSLPAIKLLMPQNSDLVVSVLNSEGPTFQFMVSNKGNRPAAITEAALEFPSNHKGQTLKHWVRLEESGFKSLVIEPDKAYRFSSDVMSGLPPLQPSPGLAVEAPVLLKTLPENCSLKVVYVDFAGVEKVIRKPYRCAAAG